MKEVKYEDWIEMIKELNAGQPSLVDLVNRSIESIEESEKSDKK